MINNDVFLNKVNACWISWHKVPRSRNIAKYLGIPLFEYFKNKNVVQRHLLSSVWTIKKLREIKPQIVFLHFSYLLLLIVVLHKLFSKRKIFIIADCHNKALKRTIRNPFNIAFQKFKKFVLSYSDLAIVTNRGLINEITKYQQNYFVLPDKIPTFEVKKNSGKEEKYCVYISSFDSDEPVEEVLETSKLFKDTLLFYWTGRQPLRFKKKYLNRYSNIIYTGYLDYSKYYELLSNAECILILSREDEILQCGAYEGLNANVPLVISDNTASREYFSDAAVFTKITPEEIKNAIDTAIANRIRIIENSKRIRAEREIEFNQLINTLIKRIKSYF